MGRGAGESGGGETAFPGAQRRCGSARRRGARRAALAERTLCSHRSRRAPARQRRAVAAARAAPPRSPTAPRSAPTRPPCRAPACRRGRRSAGSTVPGAQAPRTAAPRGAAPRAALPRTRGRTAAAIRVAQNHSVGETAGHRKHRCAWRPRPAPRRMCARRRSGSLPPRPRFLCRSPPHLQLGRCSRQAVAQSSHYRVCEHDTRRGNGTADDHFEAVCLWSTALFVQERRVMVGQLQRDDGRLHPPAVVVLVLVWKCCRRRRRRRCVVAVVV